MAGAMSTGWKKGQSGNPSGRPKINADVTKLAAEDARWAFKRIIEISQNASHDVKVRLQANQYIVDRACGKPSQAINLGDQDGGPLQISVIIKEKDAGTRA